MHDLGRRFGHTLLTLSLDSFAEFAQGFYSAIPGIDIGHAFELDDRLPCEASAFPSRFEGKRSIDGVGQITDL
jgi:hypothetical protein